MDEPSLSQRELKILAEIEDSLVSSDPSLGRKFSGADRSLPKRRLRVGLIGFVAGIALFMGFVSNVTYGVVGFVLMLVSLVAIVTSARELGVGAPAPKEPAE